ncbi:MAG TPA: hypothetical protein VNP92_00270, partial [Actinophytocola sp.]|nr:hypothetical protein [Actinophytocola sp.]
ESSVIGGRSPTPCGGPSTAVTTLSSVRARRRLEPLVAALEARPGSDAKELGRMARQVATTRA